MQQQRFDSQKLRILALDTSGRHGTLALALGTGDQSELIEMVELPVAQRTAQSLLPELDALLTRAKWQPTQLGLVCVASGPGSFTGLRIGITAAKTIAYATGAKLVGVHTLLAMAEPLQEQGQPVWTILDAQRQQLFAARHPANWRSQLNYQCETQLIDNDRWLEMLQPREVVSGPPLKTLSAKIPDFVFVAEEPLWSPTADSIAKLGYSLFRGGREVDPMQLVPSYFRKSAAEEKADLSKNP